MNLTEYDIERDSDAQSEMLVKSGGSKGVPLIDIEGIILKGFSPESVDSAVRQRQKA